MKLWKKILYSLIIGLIILWLLFMRYLALEAPYWAHPLLHVMVGILRAMLFISEGTLLMDILLALGAYLAIILVPCQEPWPNLRRFLLRPAIAIAVFLLLRIPSWGMINQISDQAYHAVHSGKYQQIRQMIAESEYTFALSGGSHATQTLSEHLPELTTRGTKKYKDGSPVYYASDAVLVDADVPSVTFCDYGGPHDPTYQTMTLPLEPAEAPPIQYDWKRVYGVTGHDCQLIYYFTGDDNFYGGDYTLVYITLQLPDGTFWITSDLIDPDTGENYDINCYPADEFRVRQENQ